MTDQEVTEANETEEIEALEEGNSEVEKWKALSRENEKAKKAALAELDRYRKAEDEALEQQLTALDERTRERVEMAIKEGLSKKSALKLFSGYESEAPKEKARESIRPNGFDKKPIEEKTFTPAEKRRQERLNRYRSELGYPLR